MACHGRRNPFRSLICTVFLLTAAVPFCSCPVRAGELGIPFGFQGARYDDETGLYYFRNRYYDPKTGRFLQRDPVWDAGNVGGQYSFAGNSPITRRDPLGLQPPSPVPTPAPLPPPLPPPRPLIEFGRTRPYEESWSDWASRQWGKWGPGGSAFRAGGAVDDFATGGMLKVAEKESGSKSDAAYLAAGGFAFVTLADYLTGGGKSKVAKEVAERTVAKEVAGEAGGSVSQRLWQWIVKQYDEARRLRDCPDSAIPELPPIPTRPSRDDVARAEQLLQRPTPPWSIRPTETTPADFDAIRDRALNSAAEKEWARKVLQNAETVSKERPMPTYTSDMDRYLRGEGEFPGP